MYLYPATERYLPAVPISTLYVSIFSDFSLLTVLVQTISFKPVSIICSCFDTLFSLHIVCLQSLPPFLVDLVVQTILESFREYPPRSMLVLPYPFFVSTSYVFNFSDFSSLMYSFRLYWTLLVYTRRYYSPLIWYPPSFPSLFSPCVLHDKFKFKIIDCFCHIGTAQTVDLKPASSAFCFLSRPHTFYAYPLLRAIYTPISISLYNS